jgi:two-component system, NtrC family, sensor kinase
MSNPVDVVTAQLKEACKVTGARWAAWLIHNEGHWEFSSKHGLSKARQAALSDFISQQATAAWMAGTVSSGRTRFRQTSTYATQLTCGRVFVFPDVEHHSVLMVGADQLEKASETFFKVLSAYPPTGDCASTQADQQLGSPLSKRGRKPRTASAQDGEKSTHDLSIEEALFNASSNPEDMPRFVLEHLTRSLHCDSALLTIRSGDTFRVEGVWNGPENLLRMNLPLAENELLAEMVNTRQGIILDSETPLGNDKALAHLYPGANKKVNAWMGIPIVLGQRVIGHLAFISARSGVFSSGDLKRLTRQVSRLAYAIENAMVFTEAARYLQQFALLNELASTASVGADTNEVARRIMQRLRKTFRTDIAGVLLNSADSGLREYGVDAEESAVSFLAKTKLVRGVLKSGLPVRVGSISKDKNWGKEFIGQVDINSILVVPLKYRRTIMGALLMASIERNAFSLEDEQLLVVIASHLAGMVENVRLHQETRERVRNLTLLHQVVQKVLGLNDIEKIANTVADLMVKRFSYAAASVILMDETGQRRLAIKKGEIKEPRTTRRGRPAKTPAQPIEGSLSGDVQLASNGIENHVFELQAASSICVPLKEGDNILGVIEVERSRREPFSENDLLALEALAGVLSSIVISALRYQELQGSVKQLHAARETALDIAGDLELHTLLELVAYRARELVNARGVELGLLNETGDAVEIVISSTPWFDSQGMVIPLTAGVAGQVAAYGEPVVVDDYNTWIDRINPDTKHAFNSVLGIPLKFHSQVIGVLILLNDRKGYVFQSEDVRLLELLAPQLSIWIRNARLYKELEERIEAQRRTEAHLIRSARLAAVGEMAAGVAYELNNPITALSRIVEQILAELAPDSPYKPGLELGLQEAHRARDVVWRLLDFFRPTENRRVSTDINKLSQDALNLINHQARMNKVQLVYEFCDGLPDILIDADQIKQVLLNLLNNAIQAMPDGGQLSLTTSRATSGYGKVFKKGIAISIADTGVGIPPENIERLFEPFFTTRPPGTGTGLGLSVSYGIITDHDGYIDVESQVNRGSRMTVFLPYENQPSYARANLLQEQ